MSPQFGNSSSRTQCADTGNWVVRATMGHSCP